MVATNASRGRARALLPCLFSSPNDVACRARRACAPRPHQIDRLRPTDTASTGPVETVAVPRSSRLGFLPLQPYCTAVARVGVDSPPWPTRTPASRTHPCATERSSLKSDDSCRAHALTLAHTGSHQPTPGLDQPHSLMSIPRARPRPACLHTRRRPSSNAPIAHRERRNQNHPVDTPVACKPALTRPTSTGANPDTFLIHTVLSRDRTPPGQHARRPRRVHLVATPFARTRTGDVCSTKPPGVPRIRLHNPCRDASSCARVYVCVCARMRVCRRVNPASACRRTRQDQAYRLAVPVSPRPYYDYEYACSIEQPDCTGSPLTRGPVSTLLTGIKNTTCLPTHTSSHRDSLHVLT